MSESIEITHAQAVPTAVIRERVERRELPRFVPAACGEVWSYIQAAKLPKPGRHVAVYLDGNGTTEVGAEVGESFTGNERVHCSQLPAGRVATVAHFGPYGGLGKAHTTVQQWCEAQGHALAGVCWEVYGHWDESWNRDPSKIRTDVFYLLRES